MLSIKILGTGCPNCKKLEQETRKVIKNLAIEAQIDHVTDYGDITEYGVMNTPALVIDEKVVSSGKVLSQGEITAMITEAL